MTFLYKEGGPVSRVAWQVASETCLYLKFNLWGVAKARFEPRPVPEHKNIAAAFQAESSQRLPVKPIQMMQEKYPEIDPAMFAPSGLADVSVYGFVIDGIHYRSECPTRYGNHPYCDSLDLPSYSLAKSVFAGLGYLLLAQKWPDFSDMMVTDLIPECDLDDQRWQQVSMRHLVDMRTGLYQSLAFEEDENASKMQAFFLAESHQQKVRFACTAWPQKSAPGKSVVYHTTDTYLLGTAMNSFLKKKLGPAADIYTFLHEHAFRQLALSPLSRWTQRTYDRRAQPFTGFGLVFHADDIAKIAKSLNAGSGIGKALAGADFNAAMFREADYKVDFKNLHGEFTYNNGFWGYNAAQAIACPFQTWIPFMSGYGGIVVAMIPNGGVYYYFSDSGQHGFEKAAVEANKALNYCKES